MKYNEALRDVQYRRNTKYILIGSESYLKEQFIQEAKKAFPEVSSSIYSPSEIEEVIVKLSSSSLFDSQMLILKRFDKIKNDALLSLIEQTPHMIIAVASDSADPRTKLMSKSISLLAPVECYPLREYGDEYPLWVLNKMTTAGYTVDEGVDSYVHSMVGSNFAALDNEIKKIFLYKTSDKHITKADAEEVISSFSHKTSYDVLDAFLRGNIANVLVCFNSYSKADSNYVALILFLQHYMEKIFRAALLLEQKTAEDDIAGILNIPRFIMKTKYLPRVRSLGKDKIGKLFNSLCNFDIKLRTFKGDKKVLMDHFFMSYN